MSTKSNQILHPSHLLITRETPRAEVESREQKRIVREMLRAESGSKRFNDGKKEGQGFSKNRGN